MCPASELLMKVKEAFSQSHFQSHSILLFFCFCFFFCFFPPKTSKRANGCIKAERKRGCGGIRTEQQLQQTRWCLNSNITLHFSLSHFPSLSLSHAHTPTHTHSLSLSLSSCINKTIHQAKKQGRWRKKPPPHEVGDTSFHSACFTSWPHAITHTHTRTHLHTLTRANKLAYTRTLSLTWLVSINLLPWAFDTVSSTYNVFAFVGGNCGQNDVVVVF